MKTILAMTIVVFVVLVVICAALALFHGLIWIVGRIGKNAPAPDADRDHEMIDGRPL